MNVNLDRIALELGRATLARILAEQRAEEAEAKLAEQAAAAAGRDAEVARLAAETDRLAAIVEGAEPTGPPAA